MKKANGAKRTQIWTLHYGEPISGAVIGHSARPGKVIVEVLRGRARVPVTHAESAVDLYPSKASALAAAKRTSRMALKQTLVRARRVLRRERKSAKEAARYHKKEVMSALAGLMKAERAYKAAR